MKTIDSIGDDAKWRLLEENWEKISVHERALFALLIEKAKRGEANGRTVNVTVEEYAARLDEWGVVMPENEIAAQMKAALEGLKKGLPI